MNGRRIGHPLKLAALLALALAPLVGCAATMRPKLAGVPIEKRPTPAARPDSTLEQPPAPAPEPAKQEPPAPKGEVAVAPAKNDTAAAHPRPSVESVMSPEERKVALEQVVADTTAANTAVKRCGSRKLLPDQQSVYDTTVSLMAQTRAALARDEVWRAQSLARKARQLAASLDCP